MGTHIEVALTVVTTRLLDDELALLFRIVIHELAIRQQIEAAVHSLHDGTKADIQLILTQYFNIRKENTQ